jgi:hypothetical protein
MRRTDAFLAIVVGAFALFVGSGVVGRRGAQRVGASVQQKQSSPDQSDRAGQRPPVADALPPIRGPRRGSDARDVNSIQRGEITRVANAEQVRAQIAAATGGYLANMLAADSGLLVRWPDRREKGLRIWVQSITSVRDWNLRYAQMARDAFADWGDNGLPARLDFVLDSATADIRIAWVDRFPPEEGRRVGNTTRANDRNGWLVSADVSVAVHDSLGQTIEPSDLAGIVRHEAGHALGLGHSNDSTTKMYPVEMTNDITRADRATLRLLYQLSPGSVR